MAAIWETNGALHHNMSPIRFDIPGHSLVLIFIPTNFVDPDLLKSTFSLT